MNNSSNQSVNKQSNPSDNNIFISKYLKIWLILMIVITCCYLFCQIIIAENFSIYTMNDTNRKIIRQMTPKYPPPLLNFMNHI